LHIFCHRGLASESQFVGVPLTHGEKNAQNITQYRKYIYPGENVNLWHGRKFATMELVISANQVNRFKLGDPSFK
jgi:hypothetical protein